MAWDRVPALANFSQSGFFLSPAGDGVKEVRLDYFVVEPTRVEIRVTGPEPVSPSSPPSRLVRSTSREYGSIGPQSFAWDGRDDSNAVVPDGRYTVLLNGLPFRVEVDSTPPEIDYRFDDPHVVAGAPFAGPVCTTFRRETDPAVVELGRVMGWQERFAVDPNLKAWRLVTDSLVMDSDSEPVYEPEIGPDGLPILDQGVPRVRRENGRPVRERRERGLVGGAEGVRFEAEDLAGNHSVVAVPSVTEGVWALGAAARCVPVLGPPVVAEKDAPDATKPPVNELAPRDVVLAAGQTLGSPPTEQKRPLLVRAQRRGRSTGAADDRAGRPRLVPGDSRLRDAGGPDGDVPGSASSETGPRERWLGTISSSARALSGWSPRSYPGWADRSCFSAPRRVSLSRGRG